MSDAGKSVAAEATKAMTATGSTAASAVSRSGSGGAGKMWENLLNQTIGVLVGAALAYWIGKSLLSQFMPASEEKQSDTHKQRLIARWKKSSKSMKSAA